jgi:ribonuclease PH
VGGKVLLDLPFEEDARAEVDMNVVATGSGRFVEIQGTGEECTFSRGELEELTTLALEGIAELTTLQEQAVAEADLER